MRHKTQRDSFSQPYVNEILSGRYTYGNASNLDLKDFNMNVI